MSLAARVDGREGCWGPREAVGRSDLGDSERHTGTVRLGQREKESASVLAKVRGHWKLLRLKKGKSDLRVVEE